MVWRSDMCNPRWGTLETNIGWSTPFCILHPPRIDQDVHGPQAEILVEWDERDIVEYVALCDIYRWVKAEHQRLAGLLQPLHILVLKWDKISMDFIVGLPRTQNGNDSIWVIVDRLTKVAHFIPVKVAYWGDKLAQLYIDNILRLHGVPSQIVSDRGIQFVA
jgi:hypothetical protein